ncbi:MAG: MFS transporter [Candidatus Korarchaeota archaeon]|nr:MFS transporter [Candidatus Korarchaeota archaeon]NIU82912.1 MFS transporter [Candidatus Thorarchaeota archaeon]NIW14178.1 MFS transporter [Candidatus Thorarchaeota archaeon]NIW52286.1 MFS transporter [Candidatus Korarchaeota archaeon]
MERQLPLLTKSGIALIPLQLTAGLIFSLFFTFIPLQIFDLYGFIASSLCRSLVAVTAISLSWLWGWISDHVSSKKKLLGIALAGQAIFTMAFSLTSFFEKTGFIQLLFLLTMYTLASLFTSLYNPVKNSLITLLSGEEGRGTTIGLFFLFSSAGWGLGGFLMGYVLQFWPLSKIVIVVGLFHTCSLIVFLFLFQEKKVQTEEPITRGIIESFKAINPFLLQIAFTIILISVGRGIFLPIFQIKMWIVFDKQSLWIGIITALSGIGGAVGSLLYGHLSDRIGNLAALTLGILGNFALFLLGILNYPLTVALVWILPIWPLIAVSSVAFAADYSQDTRRGEAQGIIESARSFSGLFSVIGGVIATLIGAEGNINRLAPIFLFLCLFPLLAFLPLWKVRKK